MIIWSGFGFLPVILLVIFSIVFGADQKTPNQDREFAYAFLLTGVISGALGWWLSKKSARRVIDKATGKEVVLRRRHALFFIPMVYWGPIFLAIGIYLWVKG